MIACNICDIKLFTKKLFIGETFDRFLLKEAEIVTFNTFSIDGRVHKSFYSEEERAEGQIEEYSTWKTLRPFSFSLIKGKKLPERFSIILKLPKAATEQFLTARKSQWLPEQVGGLFLNIHYENQHLSCVTGLSLNQFTLDKTLEREVKGSVDTDQIPKDWVRCEFQLRNDAAASFIRSWQSNGSIGLTFMGIMKNQLLYVSQYDGKNRDRATVAPWGARLLGDAEQIRMAYDAGKDYNFDSLKRYIFHQAGSSIKAYLAIMDGDFGPLLQGVRMAALNDRQTELIRSAQEQRREWQQRQIEYNKM